MTKDHSDAKKAKPAESAPSEPVATPSVVTRSVVTPAPEATVVVAYEATPVVSVEPIRAAAVEEPLEPFGYTTGLMVDARPLAQKSFEIWDENLNALLAHFEQLAGVKDVEEAISLQTRFATERFESFGRHSRDLVALTQQLASFGVAPLCGARAAA